MSSSRFVETEPTVSKKTSRRYRWTSFKEEEPTFVADKMVYMIYQPEICPSTDRPHWQGFVVLKTSMRFPAIKKLIGDPALHLETCDASDEANINYCSKEETRKPGGKVVEHGERPKGQGSRSDLHVLVDTVSRGGSLAELVADNPSQVRNLKYARDLQMVQCVDSRFNPRRKIITLYGPSGCGKTRLAHHIGGGSVARVPDFTRNAVWFDGCHKKKVVLIDDFDPNNAPHLSVFKQYMDNYDFMVKIKGSFCMWCPDIIIITTNYHPDTWYQELNFDPVTKMPLSEKDMSSARDVINRRIMPNFRDCYVTPLTQLDFHLTWDKVESGNPVFTPLIENDEGHLTDPE